MNKRTFLRLLWKLFICIGHEICEVSIRSCPGCSRCWELDVDLSESGSHYFLHTRQRLGGITFLSRVRVLAWHRTTPPAPLSSYGWGLDIWIETLYRSSLMPVWKPQGFIHHCPFVKPLSNDTDRYSLSTEVASIRVNQSHRFHQNGIMGNVGNHRDSYPSLYIKTNIYPCRLC